MPLMSAEDRSYNLLMKRFLRFPNPRSRARKCQDPVWERQWECTNDDVDRALRVVLMHRPGDEVNLVNSAAYLPEIGRLWRSRRKVGIGAAREPPDLPAMQSQHDTLTQALRNEGVEVVYLEDVPRRQHKSISTRDAVIAIDGGAIVCRLGTRYRRGEELAATRSARQTWHAPSSYDQRDRRRRGRQFRLAELEDGGVELKHPRER